MKLEQKNKEKANNSIKELQTKLSVKKDELSTTFHHNGAMKNQVSELEKEAKDLRNSIPDIEV